MRLLLVLLLLLAPLTGRAQDAFSDALPGLGGGFAQQAEATDRLGALGDPRAASWGAELAETFAAERRRGVPPHYREEGQVALYVLRDAAVALELARQNFVTQKDTRDLRLLADAALASGDAAAVESVRQWLAATGFEDLTLQALMKGTRPFIGGDAPLHFFVFDEGVESAKSAGQIFLRRPPRGR